MLAAAPGAGGDAGDGETSWHWPRGGRRRRGRREQGRAGCGEQTAAPQGLPACPPPGRGSGGPSGAPRFSERRPWKSCRPRVCHRSDEAAWRCRARLGRVLSWAFTGPRGFPFTVSDGGHGNRSVNCWEGRAAAAGDAAITCRPQWSCRKHAAPAVLFAGAPSREAASPRSPYRPKPHAQPTLLRLSSHLCVAPP